MKIYWISLDVYHCVDADGNVSREHSDVLEFTDLDDACDEAFKWQKDGYPCANVESSWKPAR
jgi:hypothetical protein